MLDSIFAKGAVLCSLCSCTTPLQLIKTRMMVNSQLKELGRINQMYKSIPDCAKTMFNTQGILSFWKGNSVMMARVFSIQSINFYVRRWFHSNLPNALHFNVLSAVLAGLTASSIVYPSDIVRQYMNNNTKKRITVSHAIKTMYSNYGFWYFYKGFPNFCLTMCTYRACYNGSFDTNKHRAKNIYQKGLIAYLCTLGSELVTFPIEGIRRRRIIINSKKGFLGYAQKVFKEGGLKAFYRGWKVVPFQSITWGIVLIVFDTAGIEIVEV